MKKKGGDLFYAEVLVDFSQFLSADTILAIKGRILREYQRLNTGANPNWFWDIEVDTDGLESDLKKVKAEMARIITQNSFNKVYTSKESMLKIVGNSGLADFVFPQTGVVIPAWTPIYQLDKQSRRHPLKFMTVTGDSLAELSGVGLQISNTTESVSVKWAVTSGDLSADVWKRMYYFDHGRSGQSARPISEHLQMYLAQITLEPWLKFGAGQYESLGGMLAAMERI